VNRETLEMLITAHEAEVYRYVKYLGADHALAEDIAQETFLAAYRNTNPPPMEDLSRRAAWLRGIARNKFLTHCRQEKRNPLVMNSDALAVAESVWMASDHDDETLQASLIALDACLAQLPERTREILRLRYEENRSRDEMAAALALGPEGVKTALRRIRTELAACIEKRLRKAGS